jgi:hypothetical protein
LTTNESESPLIRIPVRGYAESPVGFGQPTVFFRGLRPGQQAEAEIELDLPTGLDASELRVKTPATVPLTVEVRSATRGPVLVVRWTGLAQPQWVHAEVEITANLSEDAIPARLPFTVQVMPALEVFPPSVVLGATAEDAETWKRVLRVESCQPLAREPEVKWGDSRLEAVASVTITKNSVSAYSIELTGNTAELEKKSLMSTTLTVTIAPGMAIVVPIRIERGKQ